MNCPKCGTICFEGRKEEAVTAIKELGTVINREYLCSHCGCGFVTHEEVDFVKQKPTPQS